MRRVIFEEFKKVFKNKINIALLVILFLVSGYLNYRTYHNSSLLSPNEPTIMEKGEPISALEIYRKLDNELESKSGIIDKEKYELYYQEYLDKMNQTYKNDEYDMVKAEEMYGKYTQEIIEKSENNGFTEADFEKYCERQCYYSIDDQNNIKFSLPYKNDGLRFYLNILYFSYYGTDSIEQYDMRDTFTNPFYVMSHIESFKFPDGYNREMMFGMEKEMNEDTKKIATYLSEKMDNNEYEFHSTIANNLFLENLQTTISIFALLVIAIIIADIFARESYLKTDQIIVPTKVGNIKLTIAKIFCAITIGVSVILILWLIALLSSMMYLPIHDLDSLIVNMSNTYTSSIEYVFTYQEVILLGLFVTIASAIVTVFITITLSYFTKNRFATIIPIFLFLFVPMFVPLNYLFDLPLLDFIMPSKAISFINFFLFNHQGMGSPYVIIGDNIIPAIYITLIIFIVTSIVLASCMLVHSKKHIVNNR